MTCPKCGEFYTKECECGYRVQKGKTTWVVVQCAEQDCGVMIRYPLGIAAPTICKWHRDGTARPMRDTKQWPWGMPDPLEMWPWMTEMDRERKIRTEFWQARFRSHDKIKVYRRWILKPEAVSA